MSKEQLEVELAGLVAMYQVAPQGGEVLWVGGQPDETGMWAAYATREECLSHCASATPYTAQQPAAVDEAMVERALNAYFADQCQLVDKESKLFRAMKAALTAALAGQQQGGAK